MADRTAHAASAWPRAYAAAEAPSPWDNDLRAAAPCATAGRGPVDAWAAWARWHNDEAAAPPFSSPEQPWYAALERARCETLAAATLPGMALNLSLQGAQGATLAPALAPLAWLYRAGREVFAGAQAPSLPLPPATPSRAGWRAWWPGAPPAVPAPSAHEVNQVLRAATLVLHSAASFAQAVRPLVQALAASHGESLASNTLPLPRHAMNRLGRGEHPPAHTEPIAADGTAWDDLPSYPVFDRSLDETALATRWLQPDDLARLDHLPPQARQAAQRAAQRLLRALQAAQLRRWAFDQESGMLDSRRLSRLLTNSGQATAVFKLEANTPLPRACVTLLVDQSGSMKGPRAELAAAAVDLAVQVLSRCGQTCEVLGYTTVFGAEDNPLLARWQATGSPARPGRLNALRHIVYKTARQPWSRVRRELGLMLRAGFGHENVDGEALHWAASRLAAQPEPRKVLVVISDGMPFDAATAQANGRTLLETHLHAVVSRIEASGIALLALGARQSVGRFYRHSRTVQRPQDIASALFEGLTEMLCATPDGSPR